MIVALSSRSFVPCGERNSGFAAYVTSTSTMSASATGNSRRRSTAARREPPRSGLLGAGVGAGVGVDVTVSVMRCAPVRRSPRASRLQVWHPRDRAGR